MSEVSRDQVLATLRNGTPDERVAFVRSLPPSGFKDTVLGAIGAGPPGMAVVVLASMIMEYCYGRHPEVGAALASAAHERAVELWETVPDHGLLPTTLSGLASSHVKALSLLGRSEEVLEVGGQYIERYEQMGETENLPALKVLRIDALVNLRRIDEAAEELQDEELLQHPIAGMEARRLKEWVDVYHRDPATPKSDAPRAPAPPETSDLLKLMKTTLGLAVGDERGKELAKLVDGLDPSNRVDPADPGQFATLLETLKKGEQFFVRGGQDSELVVRGKIREASGIFVHGTPTEQQIRHSLAELESSLLWARAHGVSDLINDALWGMYLCHSRLQQPSEAADSLIELRGCMESMRAGIKDPMKRGGIFGAYRYLFNAMCDKLQEAGRFKDLLEAIESSKGRVIADRLTQQSDEVVPDAAIYGCVARLPELARHGGFHYLTYFVDEERVYAVLVSKKGEIHGIEPIHIKNTELREASESVKPARWGQKKPWSPGSGYPDVSKRLQPLAAALDGFLESGVVEEGDHICYSSDDDFHNVPLHYLRLRDGIVLDRLSVSRVLSAFQLDRLMREKVCPPPDRYDGFIVPLRQDLEKEDGEQMLASLEAPVRWLEAHGMPGETLRLAEATLQNVKDIGLAHAIVHFSTHGWFPEKGNPFHESYLLLADEAGLPDIERVVRGEHEGRLTPHDILHANLDLEGSHVSMMACLSGLAKEGIAGDILGLDWALIQCGASSLISTHWKVSAACAARFFEHFYQKWIEGKQSRASAWRDTMLELINGDYTPASLDRWTGFSLTGDFR